MWKCFTGMVLLAGLFAMAGLSGSTVFGDPPDKDKTAALEESLKKANVDGKYRMLLHQIKVPDDVKTYQQFKDLGFRDQREYGGHTGLTAGHWVYVAPYWYIWRDLSSVQRPRRDWGPEQATGEPDTNMAGDIVTAWGS